MMPRVSRRSRRRFKSLSIIILLFTLITYTILPYDSATRLALHFNASRLYRSLRNTVRDRDAWTQASGPYSVDLPTEVGYLIKTGYGTRYRVPDQLKAFSDSGGVLGAEGESYLVVGDWTTVNETDGKRLGAKVHDVIGKVLEDKVPGRWKTYPRLVKYKQLQAQIEVGDEIRANELGRQNGWELDALKFIMGMEMMYKKMPNKKWYIILDDDTFMIRPSLQRLLSHLDPRKPLYVGNAVGDFKARFAHGGSGIIISGEAMRRLFAQPGIVAQAYAQSMEETWGDRLVAMTLQKLGVYILEDYNHLFNGEPPGITRLWGDRFCSPLVSFHGIRRAGEMLEIGKKLAGARNPVRWRDVWETFGGSPLSEIQSRPMELSIDHVGRTDEHTKTWRNVQDANACMSMCQAHGWCLAWTFEIEAHRCHGSPWFLLASPGAESKASGVHYGRVRKLMSVCPR